MLSFYFFFERQHVKNLYFQLSYYLCINSLVNIYKESILWKDDLLLILSEN